MKREEAISRLQQHEAELKRLGVEHLYMFSSTARGEAGDDSDVDLFLIMKNLRFCISVFIDVLIPIKVIGVEIGNYCHMRCLPTSWKKLELP